MYVKPPKTAGFAYNYENTTVNRRVKFRWNRVCYRNSKMAGRPVHLVNKQYNSPINLYSANNVNEVLNKQSRILNNGAVG